MNIKNILITSFVNILRLLLKTPPKIKGSKRILIVTTTALGDTIWATPAIAAIKKTDPTCHLSILTSKIGHQVLKAHPLIDKIYILKKPHIISLIALFAALRKNFIDTVFVFHTSQRAIIPLCALLQPGEILGNKTLCKGLDHLLTHALEQQMEHEIERRLRMVEKKGYASDQKHLQLFPSALDYLKIADWKKKHGIEKASLLIGMHPGSKDVFKRWPIECFSALGNSLKDKHQGQIIITGSPQEKILISELSRMIPGSIPLLEPLSIMELSALISSFDLFITNDTGPMHIACAMNTKTIALFTATDSAVCGPYHMQKVAVIQKEKTCTPCLRKKCYLPFCMLQIGVHEVEKMAETLLLRK